RRDGVQCCRLLALPAFGSESAYFFGVIGPARLSFPLDGLSGDLAREPHLEGTSDDTVRVETTH
ncbi:unnamed protein product, partial [Ixodes persulcatus]